MSRLNPKLFTTISILKTTRTALGDICHKNQSYDNLIQELIALRIKDKKKR